MAANHISKDKIVGQFFNRASRRADISGNVPSDHFVTSDGRKGRRTPDKVKIQGDVQHPGRCYEFDSSKHIYIDNNAATSSGLVQMMNNKSWSISCYIKLNGVATLQDIMTNNQGSTENLYFLCRSGKLSATLYHDTTDARVTCGISIDDGEFHEVILEYNWSDKYLRFYIDGVECPTYDEQQQGIGGVTWSLTRASTWHIGKYGDTAPSNRSFTGKMYGIRFYDRLVFGEDVLDYTSDSLASLTGEEVGEVLYDLDNGAQWVCNSNNVLASDSDVHYSWFNQSGYNTLGHFDGTSHIDYGNNGPLQITGDISFGAWVKIDNSVIEGAIISKYGFGPVNNRAWQLRITSGLVEVYISNNGTIDAGHFKRYQATPGFDVTDGNWHFVVATFHSASSELKIYIDNVESLCTKSKDDPITGIANVSQAVYIGAIDDGSPVTFLKGELRGAFIYDRVLTNSEISEVTNPLLLPKDYVLFEDFEKSEFVSYVPAQVSNVEIDVEQFPLKYKGGLAPRIQLVNAPCLSLNGVDQRVSFTEIVLNPVLHCFVLIFKMNGSAEPFTYLLSRGNTSLLALSLSGNNALSFRGDSSSGSRIIDFTFNNNINDGEWHTLVINVRQLVNNTEETVMYLDGFANNEGYQQEDFFGGTGFTDIGHDSSRTFDGSLSFLGVYSKNLTQSEIEEFSQTHSPPSDSAVIRKYVFSEGSGTVVYDMSGNNNHGQVLNPVLPGIWGTQDVYHYDFYYGFNSYYSWSGSNYVRLNTGWELANDWKVILRDVYVVSSGSFPVTLFSLNGAYYTYINVDISGEAARLQIGVYTTEEFINIPVEGVDLFDGKSHTIEVIKSSIGNGSGNGVKVIFDGVDLGWDQAIADTTLDNIPQSSRTTIGHYFSDTLQNFRGLLGDVEYYDINDNLIKKFTASKGYKDQLGTSPLSASPPLLTSVPSKYYSKDILDKELEFKGYADTGSYNGASDVRFPDIPEIPSTFRGKIFSQRELIEENIYHRDKKSLLLTDGFLTRSAALKEVGLHPKMKELINQGLVDGQSVLAANNLLYSIEEDFDLDNDFYAIYPMVGETSEQLRVNVLDDVKGLIEGVTTPVYTKEGIYLPYTSSNTVAGVRLIAPYLMSDITTELISCQMLYHTLDTSGSNPNYSSNLWTYWGFTNQDPDRLRLSRNANPKYFMRLQSGAPADTTYTAANDSFLALSRQDSSSSAWKFIYDDNVASPSAAFSTSFGTNVNLRLGGHNSGGTESNEYVGTFKFFAIGRRNFTQTELELMREKVRKFQSNMNRE